MSCLKICTGDLNKKIKIIDKSQDGLGCSLNFLTPTKATVWAKIETIDTISGNGRRIFDNTNVGQTATHKMTIRGRTDIKSDDLIEYNDRYFTIQGFKNPNEDTRWLILYCIERGDVNNSRNEL
ncbi:MAG: head-tail adaptor protein [Gammaproteobacteria bacterium]|nr:head-tail adaptor protein [Gammaproteobacteria bacterium]